MTMDKQISCFSDYAATLGESPVWDDRAARLFWVDIEAGLMLARGANTETRWQLPERVGAVGLTTNPDVCVIALESGFALFNLTNERLTRLNLPESLGPDLRFNDGKCDPFGGFIAGTMSETLPRRDEAALYRLAPDLSVSTLKTGIRVSNGLAFTTDGKAVFADSPDRTIWSYDFDATGFSNEQVFVGPEAMIGVPDGAETDLNGNLWAAEWDGSRIGVYPFSGRTPTYIPLPVMRPTSCCFGGPEFSTLFITSALAPDEPHALDGHVLAIPNAGKGPAANRFQLRTSAA